MGKKLDFTDYHKAQQDKIEKDFLGKKGEASNTDLFKKVTTNQKLKKKK